MPKNVYTVVKEFFPIVEPQDVIGTQFQINPMTGAGSIINNIVVKQWVFWSRNKKIKCQIDSTCVLFSVIEYGIFEDIRNAILNIIKAILAQDNKYQGKRLGLRYINILPIHGHDNWITEQFYNALVAHKDQRTMRLITQLDYAVLEKDLHVKLKYGYTNPDYPAIMKNDCFTIDIDAICQGVIYLEDIEPMIDNMHYEVQACFEKMITDNYRNELNNEEAGNGNNTRI